MSKTTREATSETTNKMTSEITIERMGEKGDGMAHSRAYPLTLPGEIIDSTGKIIKASHERIVPFCPVFETCGGCKVQHWAHEPYQDWKVNLLTQAFAARDIETDIKPMIDAHGQGRRRVTLHVREVDTEKNANVRDVNKVWHAGLMAEGSHALVPITSCPILVPQLQNAPQLAVKFGPLFGACDVQITAADNGLDIAIKATRKFVENTFPQFDSMLKEYGITRIAVNGEMRAQLVPAKMHYADARVILPVGGFLQATADGEAAIANLITENLKKSKNILDLFCGIGPFTFEVAKRTRVHGIDSDKKSIQSLQEAVKFVAGLKPITAEARDLFVNPLTWQEINEYDTVILDPPRNGAEAQCRNIGASKLKKLLYVSCDPQSLGRDAAILIKAGFKFVSATPIDQFKYSAHLETFAVFTRA